jgi:hypothetical protein
MDVRTFPFRRLPLPRPADRDMGRATELDVGTPSGHLPALCRKLLVFRVLTALLLLTTGPASGQAIYSGVLGTDPFGCRGLWVAPGTWALLDDFEGFSPGDTVLVSVVYAYNATCADREYLRFADVQISPWHNYDFGCGVLVRDIEYLCESFISSRYGRIAMGVTGYEPGDTIRVFGALRFYYQCVGIPECAEPLCVTPEHVELCDTTTAVVPLTWGRLKARYRAGERP